MNDNTEKTIAEGEITDFIVKTMRLMDSIEKVIPLIAEYEERLEPSRDIRRADELNGPLGAIDGLYESLDVLQESIQKILK